jgi:hypothetical protein
MGNTKSSAVPSLRTESALLVWIPTLLLSVCGVSIVQIGWIISVISLAPMVGTALLMLASVSVRAFLALFWTIPSPY